VGVTTVAVIVTVQNTTEKASQMIDRINDEIEELALGWIEYKEEESGMSRKIDSGRFEKLEIIIK